MGCLDENELTALLEHQLDEADLVRIDDHVATCAACRQLVSALKRPGTTALAFAETEAAAGRSDLSPLTDALARTNAERRVGMTLCEKWTLDRVLGMGGMAQVFAATHRNGKRVAIKILRPELGADPAILKRFLQEGYAANKVEHAGAVSVLDDGVAEDGSAFLVMDLLTGETLGQRLAREQRILPDEVARVARAILEVLDAAHAKGIVHRDIKPENVFVEKSGGVRVLDFGIARVLELTRARGGTEAGAILGTPSYMPPEQARGRWDEVDARSDLWAVGATMYTLLTGEPVRRAKTLNEELLAAMTAPVPPIRRRIPSLDAALARVIDKSLALDRDARFASAGDMQRALAEAATRPSPSRGRRGVVALGIAAALVVGAVAFTRTAGTPIRADDDATRRKADHPLHAAGAAPAEEKLDTPDPAPRPAPRRTAAAPTQIGAVAHPSPPPDPAPPAASTSAPAPAPARQVLDRRR